MNLYWARLSVLALIASTADARAECRDDVLAELRQTIAPAVRYERVPLAEEGNGFALLRLAAELVRTPKLLGAEPCESPAAPEDLRIVEDNALSLWLLDESLARPRFQWAPYDAEERFHPYRQAVMLELLRARVRVARGDAVAAAGDVGSAFLLAHRMADGDAELIRFFVAIGVERAALAAMRCLATTALPEASLATLLALIDAPPTVCETYARAWRVEFNSFWVPNVQELEAQSQWRGPPLSEAVQRASEDLAAHLARCGAAGAVRCPSASSAEYFDPAAWSSAIWRWGAERVATQVVLASSLYQRRHGRPPTSLGDLVVAHLLPAPPADPMTGTLFLYDAESATLSLEVPEALRTCGIELPPRLSWQVPH